MLQITSIVPSLAISYCFPAPPVSARTVAWDGVHHFFIFTSKGSCVITIWGAVVLFPQICGITITRAASPQLPVNPEEFAIWSPQCYQLLTSNHGPPFCTEHLNTPVAISPLPCQKQILTLALLRWQLQSPAGSKPGASEAETGSPQFLTTCSTTDKFPTC